jgi:hypothetical protein
VLVPPDDVAVPRHAGEPHRSARLGAAAKPPLFLLGNKRTAGSDEARHPALVAKMFSGAPAQSDSK